MAQLDKMRRIWCQPIVFIVGVGMIACGDTAEPTSEMGAAASPPAESQPAIPDRTGTGVAQASPGRGGVGPSQMPVDGDSAPEVGESEGGDVDSAMPADPAPAGQTDEADASVIEVGASVDAGMQAAGACVPCTRYMAPTLLANVQDSSLAELSGMTASWRNPGVFFAHNDRARPSVYALDEQGMRIALFSLPDAGAVDLEDIGVGPCGDQTCLYLADIGGNISPRDEYAIFRTPEPDTSVADSSVVESVPFERFAFAYEDGRHNAEGLLVDPESGALYVVTKVADGEPSSVYALPQPPSTDSLNVAIKVMDLPIPGLGDMPASAAAAHPCGGGFLVRTYNTIYEFRTPRATPLVEAFAVQPVQLKGAEEQQSEAIAYLADGQGFLSSGEGRAAGIYVARCQ